MLENLTRANERCVAFGYEIVIENRHTVCVRFSEESVWSVIGGRTREAPVCDDKLNRVEHIQEETSSKVCGWGGGSCEGEEGECAGLVSPTRWKRAWGSSGVMWVSISSAV